MTLRVDSQLLTFIIGRDEYGVSIERIREIAEYRPLTPVPMRPPWMRGVMNLRGSVVPVIDLGAKMGLPETVISRLTCLIIVDLDLPSITSAAEPMVVAVMVDAVSRVIDVAAEDIREAPAFGMSVNAIPGMVRFDGDLVILLDLAAIVARDEVTAGVLQSVRGREEADAHQ